MIKRFKLIYMLNEMLHKTNDDCWLGYLLTEDERRECEEYARGWFDNVRRAWDEREGGKNFKEEGDEI